MNFIKSILFGKTQDSSKSNTNPKQQRPDEAEIQLLNQLFELSAKFIAESSKKISDEDRLRLYGLYKQAILGDCNTPKPSMLDFVGKNKWTAWIQNKGISKYQAMKSYISVSAQIDPEIQEKMEAFYESGIKVQSSAQKSSTPNQNAIGLKIVEQKDYSETYSHPYFRLIQKGLQIPMNELKHEFLLEKNNNPKCYPLHFAIDKQRVDLVKLFLPLLTTDEINQMHDQDGTGILEYAELIENSEIIQLIKQKIFSGS